jgi:hypothetical protein
LAAAGVLEGKAMQALKVAYLAAVVLVAAHAAPAIAGPFAMTSTSSVVNSASASCTTTSANPCAENYSFGANSSNYTTLTGNSADYYTFGSSFNSSTSSGGVHTAADFGSSVYTPTASCTPSSPNCLSSSTLLTWNFQDNYEFSTAGSGAQVQQLVLTLTAASGIDPASLEARLISTSNPTAGNLVGVDKTQINIIVGWQNAQASVDPNTGLTVYTMVLNTSGLAANSHYELEVRGEGHGNDDHYEGRLDCKPVPLPASFGLLSLGLALLAFTGLTRRLPRLVSLRAI